MWQVPFEFSKLRNVLSSWTKISFSTSNVLHVKNMFLFRRGLCSTLFIWFQHIISLTELQNLRKVYELIYDLFHKGSLLQNLYTVFGDDALDIMRR